MNGWEKRRQVRRGYYYFRHNSPFTTSYVRVENGELWAGERLLAKYVTSIPEGTIVRAHLPSYIYVDLKHPDFKRIKDLIAYLSFAAFDPKTLQPYWTDSEKEGVATDGQWVVKQKAIYRTVQYGKLEVCEVLNPSGDWQYDGKFGPYMVWFPTGRRRLRLETAAWKLRGMLKEKRAYYRFEQLRYNQKVRELLRLFPKAFRAVRFKPNPKCPKFNVWEMESYLALLLGLRRIKQMQDKDVADILLRV